MSEVYLKFVTLIQLGDIHFPTALEESNVDIHDEGFPGSIVELSSNTPLQEAARAIRTVLENSNIDGILVCGDLTNSGSIPYYRNCLNYIKDTLGIDVGHDWGEETFHAVPGNHDVDYSMCDSEILFEKFEPFKQEWENLGNGEILTTNNFRSSEISSSSGCLTQVYSLNSSVGCGEKRYHHERYREAFDNLRLECVTGDLDPVAVYNALGESLNTPVFLDNDISGICQQIREQQPEKMPILLSHHNLLPQALPRITLYSEAFNGGRFRSDLLALNRPVIYCHGHIHEDPIEIVVNPQDNNKLICISAPLLTDGFNVINIDFSEGGRPIGCKIVKYRRQPSGSVIPMGTEKIPFYDSKRATHICDNNVLEVIGRLNCHDIRFNPLLRIARDVLDTQIQKRTLASMLTEAEWFGLIEIQNYNENLNHWIIKRY